MMLGVVYHLNRMLHEFLYILRILLYNAYLEKHFLYKFSINILMADYCVRQLEHSSNRHMSPAGSEDVRLSSETEADRHFR